MKQEHHQRCAQGRMIQHQRHINAHHVTRQVKAAAPFIIKQPGMFAAPTKAATARPDHRASAAPRHAAKAQNGATGAIPAGPDNWPPPRRAPPPFRRIANAPGQQRQPFDQKTAIARRIVQRQRVQPRRHPRSHGLIGSAHGADEDFPAAVFVEQDDARSKRRACANRKLVMTVLPLPLGPMTEKLPRSPPLAWKLK
jgi:hypothetical protein